ncbi:MAG: PAS domain S-box protein [Phycisphaerae bacterium]|jgi:PAS domain S-box-containing protein|nr:PAS domain S-box protein [Phycisphaerae bacterium]
MGKKRISENDAIERKRIEMALRDSEETLKAAQKLAHVGSWQWNLRTGDFSMSDEMLRIHGLPLEDPPDDVQAIVASLVHPDDQARIRSLVEDAITGGQGQEISFRIVRTDGDVRWLAASRHTVRQRGEDGRPVVLMGTVQDITEQRAAQIALQQSEEKYRAVVESAGEAICRLNAEGVFLFMNTICAQRLGGTADELTGKTLWDVFPEGFADSEATRAREAIASGEGSLIETIVPLGDEMRWYQISMEPVRDHDGKVRSALVIARDITERKQAEEQLRQSEELHRTLFEGANEGILGADIETRKIMFANPAACRILKYSAEELLEMTVEDCHRPEDLAHVMSVFQAQARGDYKIAPAVPFRTRDGDVVHADVAAAIIRIKGRDCIVAFLRDLTDARRAEEALKTAHMKLMTARDEERKHLASELHDSVSQKLVALGMRLDNIALAGAKLPAEQGYELLQSAVTCNEIIADIKGICHGLYPPALEALGLVAAMKQLEEYCKSADLTATIHCDPVIVRVRFGPEIEIALFRIAQEAVNNAIRHSGGTNVDIDLMCADGQLVLAVVDDGEGFDMQAANGMGLGLNSMRDRARAVGAKLNIASEPGETRIEVAVAVDLEETNEQKG